MIRGTDGLDYQDLTERLLGRPAETPRNWAIDGRRRFNLPVDDILALPADATWNQIAAAKRASGLLAAYPTGKLAGNFAGNFAGIYGKSATRVILDDFPT